MALTIVETRAITGGVDTHADVYVAAALDGIGGLLGTESFSTTPAGYGELLAWLGSFGVVRLVGIEGTGSYGAGLARHLATSGVRVVEVDRGDHVERVSRILSTPSAPPGRRCRDGPGAPAKAGTARSKRSAP